MKKLPTRSALQFIPVLCLCVVFAALAGCGSGPGRSVGAGHQPPFTADDVRIIGRQTIAGVGAAQGALRHEGMIYIFGDAETGVIRQYRVAGLPDAPRLRHTGVEMRLTVDGEDIAPHPTGLTHHPDHGWFLGDTVSRRGTIFHIDFGRLLEDGTLDNAVLNTVDDDAGVNGTRPEFVRFRGRWMIATADYGDRNNAVRLYDPDRLKSAASTGEAGVLIASFPSGPFVQSLRWMDSMNRLVLVQNQTPGLGYRLTFARLDGDLRAFPEIDLPEPEDELEGFVMVAPGIGLFISAMRTDNATFVEIPGLPEN